MAATTAAARAELSQFSELLVRDYLRARGLESTLVAFDEECKELEKPSVESWYNLSHSLDLPHLLQENAAQEDQQYKTIVEVLVSRLLSEESLKRRVPTAIKVYGSGDQLTFQVPQQPGGAVGQLGSTAVPPPRLLRGAHSSVVCGGDLSGAVTGTDGAESFVSSEPASVERQLVQPLGLSSAKKKDKPKRPQSLMKANQAQQPGLRRAKRADGAKAKSDEAWIPLDVRKRIFERDLLVAKVNLEEESKRSAFIDSRAKRQSLSDLEQNKAEERYKLKRKKKCGLCFREFSVVNLVLSVPHKAIVDMQNTWTEKNSWISMDDSQKKIYQNPTKQQAPALYDEVRVCVYCAQFFQKGQQDFYRPSHESKVMERRERAEKQAAEIKKAYWDPLTTVENLRKQEVRAPT